MFAEVFRKVGFTALFLLECMMSAANGADLDALREKCIAYGATPGTSQFFSCMKELDSGQSKQEDFESRVKSECNNHDMYMKAHFSCAGQRGYDSCSGKYQAIYKQECIRNIERQVHGNKTNTRRCVKRGDDTVCEDE